MANKFKDVNDSVFRVVGEKADGSLEVLQGPYASRGVARGQATVILKVHRRWEAAHPADPIEYVDIYAQETKPDWFRV